ncbi:MAG: GTP-binding protein TypA [Candidatus Lloydbacteria bacterium RIFCSPHIGHO2_02_FULL_50_13]|uniref:50S ribosomal subunit assembly factor BipA n=1 Tax=Candidatus Lloydbacteria bacterium RIFCSPHIGHO2_02_FULL_50_13 TaxID=1798661 RepID=A0A1G2D6L5_9BACT|nr:MAG: GTP-binding protein TypA [Candidatus Lloydbacteria bacterium RIFCSPHIGHO2_02_FULL_50_13]
MEIRNIAIIAHVDHGKTTLTDAIMRQTGMFAEGESMDSNALELERGITIYSKNTSSVYKGVKINIVDTPGHADFGSEVERVLRSIDCVLLVVDAQEGPMPQTRFVLKKSLELGLKPIVVINKIDKLAADPDATEEGVLELFMDLGANKEQLDFPVVYAVGREGVAIRKLDDQRKDLSPLLDLILEFVPPAAGSSGEVLRAQPFNLAYDNYLGRLAIVRVADGTVKIGDNVFVLKEGAAPYKGKVTKLFTFRGIKREEASEIVAGDIGIVAGIPEIYIGETIAHSAETQPLPSITVDEPTIELNFLVNNSPFAGREGKFVTSRQIRERLTKELEVNVGLKVDLASASGDTFKVSGRGELHIAILLENMRREGFELQVSQPKVIIKIVDGVKHEPFEEVTIDVPSEFQGAVIKKLSERGAIMTHMTETHNTIRMLFEGPTRGLLGYRSQFIVDTKGEGIMAARVIGFKPYVGEIERRAVGSMVSMAAGKALGYSLANLQARGELYIAPTTEVYEGMVIGNTAKGDEMPVNPTKGKQLTNMRASGTDDALNLVPPHPVGIENGMEIMAEDEYMEITPKSVRLRKQHLSEAERSRAKRGIDEHNRKMTTPS